MPRPKLELGTRGARVPYPPTPLPDEMGVPHADEMDGPTPPTNENALPFKLNHKTVCYRAVKPIVEG
jgi:hypothetical protein